MAAAPAAKSLRNIALFGSLDGHSREALERRCHWREIAAHEQIIGQGDTSRDVYFLVAGKVRVVLYATSGKSVALGDFDAGEMFGEYSAIDRAQRSATVEAVIPSLVAVMSPSVFEELVATHPPVALALVRQLVAEIRALTSRVFEFSTLAVANRIHAELLRLALPVLGHQSAVIEPAPKHVDIANRISTHREAVTRELNRLVKIGVLKRHRKALHVTDLKRLARMVAEARGD